MFKQHDHRGKVEGVHKDGLVGEIRSGGTISRRVVILVRMLNKVVQRPLLVIRKAIAPSAVVMRSRQEKRSNGTGLYKRVAWFMLYLVTFRDEMEKWRMTTTAELLRGRAWCC